MLQYINDDCVRLLRLREAMGATWQELAKELGVTYQTVYYVKKGERSLGIKARRRLREAEARAGLRSAGEATKVSYEEDRDRDFAHELVQELKQRWRRRPADQDEIMIAIRVLFPKKVNEIINWLKKK